MKRHFVASLAIALSVNACTTTENSTGNPPAAGGPMLVFGSFEGSVAAASETLTMTPDELSSWEAARGFQSFGRDADDRLKSVDPQEFSSTEEIQVFARRNSEYLQLVTDGNGEMSLETRFHASPYRYLANTQGLFQVGTKLCRLTEDGALCGSQETTQEPNGLERETALAIAGARVSTAEAASVGLLLTEQKADPEFTEEAKRDCGTTASGRDTNGNERVVIELGTTNVRELDPLGTPLNTYAAAQYKIKAQKKTLGVWFNAVRHITAALDLTIAWAGQTQRFVRSWKQESAAVLQGILVATNGNGPATPVQVTFKSYDCTAHIPKPCDAALQCR